MRRAGAITFGLVAAAACNSFNGVEDLRIDSTLADGALVDGSVDAPKSNPPTTDGSAPPIDGSSDGSNPFDACAPAQPPTTLLGYATAKPTFIELTPVDTNHAGGILTPTPQRFDDFGVTFQYSLTYTGNPAAGLAFVAYSAEDPSKITCQSGANLCTLGSMIPGFAVILRTAKAAANDPDPPYVAVVDADTFPATLPTPTPVDPAKAYHQVSAIDVVPPSTSWNTMTIVVHGGTVSIALDATPYLTNAPIPNWGTGRSWRWGIVAATGAANSGHRTALRNITLSTCF